MTRFAVRSGALLGLASVLAAGVAATLWAQGAPPAAVPPAAPPAAPAGGAPVAPAVAAPPGAKPADTAPPVAIDASFTADDRNEAAIKAGKELVAKVAEAYRKAPTLSDTIVIEAVTPRGPQTEQLAVQFGAGKEARVQVSDMTITVVGGRLYIEASAISDERFVGAPLKNDSLAETLPPVTDGLNLPLPHFDLRYGTTDAEWLKAFSMGSLEKLAVVGHRVNADKDDEILFKGDNGMSLARVDGTSRLLERLSVDFRPPDAPPGFGMGVNLTFAPKVAEKLDPPITFDPGKRKEVATMQDLMRKIQIGDAAPGFELKTQTGETVKLADLKGSVVVLDMWATWCGPCRKGLPLVNDFAKWAAENNKAVKVFGVNVWEAPPGKMSDADKTAKATEFWTKQGFAFPTLLDLKDEVSNAYGPSGIPTTFIIDRNGKVAFVHSGFSPETTDLLKTDVESLLK
ncbi:MAG: TlpA disulfide reductase family protein [Phycisphaerales bacterium]